MLKKHSYTLAILNNQGLVIFELQLVPMTNKKALVLKTLLKYYRQNNCQVRRVPE